jgi:hypothetical protein
MASPSNKIVITDALITRVSEVIRGGNYRQAAARAIGVSHSTFKTWMRAGAKAPDSPEGRLLDAVERAEQSAEQGAVKTIFDAAKGGDMKAAMWFLSHRYPKRWADRTRVDQRVSQKFEPARSGAALSPEALKREFAEIGALLQLTEARGGKKPGEPQS